MSIQRSLEEEVLLREAPATEERQWVRLTRRCNNRCAFCLDTGSQDGTLVPDEEIVRIIAEGRRRNATRLILSGGEPTIHPRFCRFVSHGRRSGYTWIQTVTNGRMFAYPGFLGRAVEAGLNEITFSMPAHRPELFDELTGVKGAFEQSLAGLRNALADGRLVVSVDIVINGLNVRFLREIIEFYIDHGVREFDLLQVVPFGRAFDREDPLGGAMLYDPAEAAFHLQRALALRKRPDLVLWTNRLDPVFLEGNEVLIQDPHKIEDEVRGRLDDLKAFAGGQALFCRHPERCRHCFLKRYCLHMKKTIDLLAEGGPLWLGMRCMECTGSEIDAQVESLGRWKYPVEGILVQAPFIDAAERCLEAAAVPAGTVVSFDLARLDERAEELLRTGSSRGREVARLVVRRAEDLERALGVPGRKAALSTILSKDTASAIQELLSSESGRASLGSSKGEPLRVVLEGPRTLSEALEQGVDPRGVFGRGRGPVEGLAAEGVPFCLAGSTPVLEPLPVLDVDLMGPDGVLDPLSFVSYHVREGYRVFSLRCEACFRRKDCCGLPINTARRFGFGILEPMDVDPTDGAGQMKRTRVGPDR